MKQAEYHKFNNNLKDFVNDLQMSEGAKDISGLIAKPLGSFDMAALSTATDDSLPLYMRASGPTALAVKYGVPITAIATAVNYISQYM